VPPKEHENNRNKDGMEQLHRKGWPRRVSSEASRTMGGLVVASLAGLT
jgi:hypothetical protein